MRSRPAGSAGPAFAAVVTLVLSSGCGSAGPSASAPAVSSPASTVDATPSATPEITHVPVASGSPGAIPSAAVTVSLGGETNGVTVCAGWVWVAVGAPVDAIAQIDPATGEVAGQVDGGSNLACLDDEPWAAIGGAEVRHLDADTRDTLASAAINTYYVGTGAGSVWAPSGPDVVRIDPQTAEVIATIPVGGSNDVTEVEGSDDAVWATVKQSDAVYRIDPSTNTVVARIDAGAYAHGILVQPDAVWISNAHENTLTRIDPATNLAIFVDGPGAGVGLAEGNGYVWASSRDGDLFRIDPTTSQAVPVVRIGGWPYGIASTDDALWVSDGITSVYGIPFAALGV